MAFQKGNQYAKGGYGGRRPIPTMELIQQLNELCDNYKNTEPERTKLNRMIENLVTKATTGDDVVDKDGKLVKKGTGDLAAMREIMDRIEGRAAQKIVAVDDGPALKEYNTLEEVHNYLLGCGIDAMRVPPPPLKLIDGSKS